MMRPPVPALAALSLAGFTLSALLAEHATLPGICGQFGAAALLSDQAVNYVALITTFNSPARLFGEWALMLCAMMPMVLISPVRHIQRSSLRRRSLRSIAMFLLGYGLVWLAIAPLLLAVGILLRLIFDGPMAALVAIAIAFVWSASPAQKRALNAGHRTSRIGLFGWAADWDCIRFGVRHGLYCVVVCTPWMIVPLVADGWHFLAMALVMGAMVVERFERVMRPHWRLPPVWNWSRERMAMLVTKRRAYG